MRHYAATFLAVVLGVAGHVAPAAEGIRIVDRGQPRAVVVLPADSDAQTRETAQLLVGLLRKSSGAEIPVVSEPAPASDGSVAIHIGQDRFVQGLDLNLEKMDDDGFVIRGVDRQNFVIAGPTPYGTEFGVCEFLERYVGVRWLLPGPDGEDVPQQATIEVPMEEVRQEPAFYSRLFSGLKGGAQATWARRNRMHGRVEFHHNLHRLFPPETYTKTHPEFFPIRKGKRYFPPTNETHGWQPCFSAAGIVEEAVKNICAYFEKHSQAPSYSLGVVDSSGHCECEACQAKDPSEPNFLGRRDVSDRYFQWCNEVVEGVLQKYPDKLFGCLAYSEVAQAPSRVKVHPRIIPYMTYDRMKWIEPELRGDGEAMTRRWQAMSPVLGWYDYIYGSPYCLPRVWFHQMADYYRFGHAHGVRALYAEAYPNWGEGPKLYVSLKLQWDPRQDVDALLRDWYVRTVGEDAAEDLAAYYAHWEDFWTRRILQSPWFSKSGQYLRFNVPGYLADITEDDVTKSRAWLEAAVAKAKTPLQKARAELLLRAFEYYEASAYAHPEFGKADQTSVEDEEDALRMLDRGRRAVAMSAKRQKLMEEFAGHPVLVHPIDFDRRPQMRGEDWGSQVFWKAFDWAAKGEGPVRASLRELAASPDESLNLPAKAMLLLVEGKAAPVSKNSSFEEPAGRWPAAWSNWVKFGVGSETVSPRAARTGAQGILSVGMRRGGPLQMLEVPPGRYAATVSIRIPQPPAGSASVTLGITPVDEQGNNLPQLTTIMPARKCDWTRLAVAGELPAEIGGKRVKQVRLIVIVDGFESGEEVHIDDLALYRVD